MGLIQWIGNRFKNKTIPTKSESQANAERWLKKIAETVQEKRKARTIMSDEIRLRQEIAARLESFSRGMEGAAAALVLDINKTRVFLSDAKPVMRNFFYYGKHGYENGLEQNGASYPLSEEELANFLYITLEGRDGAVTSDSVIKLCDDFITKIRAEVNALVV